MASRSETARRARDQILGGNSITVNNEVPGMFYDPQERLQWPKVQGAFAALYSRVPIDLSVVRPMHEPDAYMRGPGMTTHEGVKVVYDTVSANLHAAFQPEGLGTVVTFENPRRVMRWAHEELVKRSPANAFTDDDFAVSYEKAPQYLSDKLTDQGFGSLIDKGIGAAVLMTEYVGALRRFTPDQVKEIVKENGYILIQPMMSSQENFMNYGQRFTMGLLTRSSSEVVPFAQQSIAGAIDDQKVALYLNVPPTKRGGEFGCPFLHTKPTVQADNEDIVGANLKSAFGIVVDTIWDIYLKPRAQNGAQVNRRT